MNFKKKSLVLIFCAASLMLAGCGSNGKGTASSAPVQEKGAFTLYTSQPEPDVQKLVAAFHKKYPDIEVHVFRSGTEEVVSKVLAEKKMGKVQADVLLVADAATFEQLKKENILDAYQSPEMSGIPSALVDKDHTYSGTKVIATGIIYNTQMIQKVPHLFAELTNPVYENTEIMPSPLYSGAAAYNLSLMTRTDGLGWEFYQGLKKNGITVDKGNGAVLKAVSEGTKGIGMVVDYMAVRAKAKGAPVEFVYPLEGVPVVTEPIGVVKGSANENLGKLFEDFVLSEDGQKETAAIGYTPVRKGVRAPEGMKSIGDIKIMSGDLAVLVQNREADKQKFMELFR